MKPRTRTAPAILTTLAAMATIAQAAVSVTAPYFNTTSTNPDPIQQEIEDPSFPYELKATFDNSTPALHTRNFTVGGWSYADLRGSHAFTGGNAKVGWGHASAWLLVEIQQAARFTFIMEAVTSGSDVRPGFVMFAGESITDNPSNMHRYTNDGSEMWRHDLWDLNGPGGTHGLTYVTHATNAAGNSLEHSLYLTPGLYTIALGNIGDSGLTTGDKTYSVTVAVPEPSAMMLSAAGLLLAFRRRRR
jgi:hypothetical protein